MLTKILLLMLFILNLFAIILSTDSRIKHKIMKCLYFIHDSMFENKIIDFPFTLIYIISVFIYRTLLIVFDFVMLFIYEFESIIYRFYQMREEKRRNQ